MMHTAAGRLCSRWTNLLSSTKERMANWSSLAFSLSSSTCCTTPSGTCKQHVCPQSCRQTMCCIVALLGYTETKKRRCSLLLCNRRRGTAGPGRLVRRRLHWLRSPPSSRGNICADKALHACC